MNAPTRSDASTALLAWYDRHARVLPWRARNGERPDPYAVWLSEIMLQQTTVATVKSYYEAFLGKWPRVEDLAAAPVEEVMKAWAGLGYYSRARNLHACAIAVARDHGGRFPDTEEGLRALPGIGPYTAAAIAAIAFGRRAVVVDGNIERVVTRLRTIRTPMPAAKPEIRAATDAITPARRAGDFAQALMDLGATICSPKRPACALCPWNDVCVANAQGRQEEFPHKAAKKEGKLRRGAAFVAVRDDGFILLRTRPDKGLLAQMTEVPGTAWSHDFDLADAGAAAPLKAGWRRLPGVVEHTFTHFPLELTVFVARVPKSRKAPKEMRWSAVKHVHDEALPTVMRKVLAHAFEIPAPARGPLRKSVR